MKNTTKNPQQGAPEVKILSESEIQDKLYGGYISRRKKPAVAAPAEAGWNGSEILSNELERLRNELLSLRKEKDRLAVTLDQMSRAAQSPPKLQPAHAAVAAVEPADIVHKVPQRSGPGWWGKLAAFAVVLGVSGYFAGGRMLQASPAAGDPTPFTVQTAVYDTLVPAKIAAQFLEEMTYKAYLVPVSRKDGRMRYRICVGNYVTRDEADLERLRLVGDPRFKHFKDAFVRVRR